MDPKFKIQPLGGVGQIGSNMISVKQGSHHILIDSGILFPYEEGFGINYLIPETKHIDPPSHLLITHGHEDHIGAVHHTIKRWPHIELWATPFTAELIRNKLSYRGIKHPIHIYNEDHIFDFQTFKVWPIHMNHSIPETMGLFFGDRDFEHSFFYASDFKVDDQSPYEKLFDFEKLRNLSDKYKTKTLFSDSTNITSSQLKTPSELIVRETLHDIFSRDYKRFFITTFSSNIHRLESIFSAAQKNQLKVVPLGRSTHSYKEAAQNCNMLNFPSSLFIEPEVVKRNQKIVVVASGCQGDFRAAFRRVVLGNDKHFSPQEGDCFILSSKAIPGNEKKIALLLNEITRCGADLITSSDEPVHASGHPGKEDLRKLVEALNPTLIVPIHGETYFLKKHKEFIESQFDIPSLNILNFDTIVLDENSQIIKNQLNKEDIQPQIIHGDDIELDRSAISARRKISENGVIFITLNNKRGILMDHLGLPEIFREELEEDCYKIIKRYILSRDKDKIKNELRRFLFQRLGYKPIVVLHSL